MCMCACGCGCGCVCVVVLPVVNVDIHLSPGALLEKKSELDKRGMCMSDYGGMNKPMVCRPQALSKDSSSDRAPFLDKVGHLEAPQ